eukprot:4366263-Pyramimonas_sp.AAC.1
MYSNVCTPPPTASTSPGWPATRTTSGRSAMEALILSAWLEHSSGLVGLEGGAARQGDTARRLDECCHPCPETAA